MINRIPLFLRIAIIFLVQACAVSWMVWDRSQILENGQIVRLQVRPIDPRDIFRGDYVILAYNISQLDPVLLGSNETYEKNDTVYVGLVESDDGFWRARSIQRALPDAVNGTVFISGRIRYRTGLTANQSVFIKFGIESYFVPEGEGREIEDARNDHEVIILAAVAANGRAAIKGLIVDGELRYEEPLF